ncbi:aldo/keto reductase [Enterobacter sp. ASE]|uniref:aldo/keto reductase n=1 Tax=Enterobacter sp. ASE TaxID=2905968 RepID=UPI001E534A6C|nr:aldo/keto reductase [Enterobacter sp. ASE]MCE3115193.1 aldo/keto reductase [Enterobacter sp. ASE]
MEYTKLGSTGLDISRLCLGCMTYGDPQSGAHSWTLDEAQSRPLLRHAIENGINFFDTANSYSAGTSEIILGKILKEYIRRDDVVIATKLYGAVGSTWKPNGQGLSRKSILMEINNSLARLQTDYVDLYQIHRWDYNTPIEETMEALHDVVKSGKVRYIGASSMYAWQFAKAQEVARRNSWTPFVSMQNHLNLLYREEEREMIPMCADQGVGLLPWSPLARGKLARPVGESSVRNDTDVTSRQLFAATEEADNRVIRVVEKIARNRGLPMAQIALAWVLNKPGVSAPIIGASRIEQMDDAIAALQIQLTEEEITALEKEYIPHVIAGHN